MNTSDQEHVISGIIKRVTYRNPDNGYSVFQMTVPDQSQLLTVVGTCMSANVGMNLMVRGIFIQHPKFGRQLSARMITETAPSTPEGITQYLSSGVVPGVGEKTAQRLVKEFGIETLDVIYKQPERLAKVSGVGKHKAALISEAFARNQDARAVMQFLLEHNISPKLANKIHQRYENQAVEILSRDPYVLARDLKGVGFATADSIAMNLGLKVDSPQRLRAGIYHALEKAADDGHCFLPSIALGTRARALLQLTDDVDLEPHLNKLIQDSYLVLDGEDLYLNHLHRAEKFVAGFIADRSKALETPIIPDSKVEESLKTSAREMGLTFSVDQRQAVLQAVHQRLLIITGGPGCGKTTIIRALSKVFQSAGKRLMLAAPTGRAAQRMAHVTGLPASTIHRLLKFDPIRGGFYFGPNEPLPTDAIIVDEASMIDLLLAKDLFSAIPKNAIIILVGDRDQLPSVGPGRVFGDLLAANQVKSVALSLLFRRSEESTINNIAHMINAGIVPDIPQPDGATKVDAYFIPRTDPDEAAQLIERLVSDQIPKKFDIPMGDICVLTPTNRGPLGTQVLNQRLQAKLNPAESRDNGSLTLGQLEFRVGDRVCQRVNNYQIDDLGVFNGDTGHIYSVNKEERSLVVEMWDGRLIEYESGDIPQLSLAYAITVHRSQGSEIPCVVLALHDSHYVLLERQLIYTGITRAKKLLIVVGSKRALSIASRRTTTKRRSSRLTERIDLASFEV